MDFKKLLLILTLVISFSSFADEYIPGEGKFLAEDGDSVSFIKSQLLYEATKDVISKELVTMGLNPELFWQKYDEKLKSSVEKLDEVLKEEYGIGTTEVNRAQMEKYRKELRYKTLIKRKKFGNLESVVISYSMKKPSRSSKNPHYRFMKIEAKLLDNKLSEIYYRFVRGKKSSDYGKLFIQVKHELKGITFSEMGIANEKDFITELSSNWLDILSKQRPSNIANIENLTSNLAERLDSISNLNPEQAYKNVPDAFVNSLLLTIYVDVKQKSLDSDQRKIDLDYSGAIELRDLQTSMVVWESSFGTTKQSFEYSNEKEIGQKAINHIYRMPLGDFKSMVSSIERFSPVTLVKVVNLFNYQNLTEVNALAKYLEQIGVQYSLKADVLTLTPTRSELILRMDATEPDLKTLIKKYESAKKDLNFELIDSDGTIGIKFNHEPAQKNI